MKIIIFTILSLIIYDILKKIFKYLFIKKQKNTLNKILHNSIKSIPIDLDFWGDDLNEK